MVIFMRIVLGLVLLASLAGTVAFVRRTSRLPAVFCPALALAGQVLVLYVLALAGLLRAGVYGVTLFGLAALAWCAFRDRGLWREFLTPGVAFFFLYVLFFALANWNLTPVGYDNFSHWAVIVKELYRTDALPGEGTMVLFTNYPPATALYEYYLLQFLGFGERQMVLAMNILEGAMVSCCFVGAQWDRRRDLLARLLLVFGVLTVIVEHFRNLYVDALLGFILLAMGILALWDDGFSKKTALPQALLGGLLILTKMSGAMLLILHAALLVVLKYRRPERPAIRAHLLALAGTCGAAYLSFHLHVSRTFGQAVSSNQFQLTLSNFADKLQGKSAQFWSEFPKALLHAYVTWSNSCSRFFFLVNLLLLALFLAAVFRRISLPRRARALIPFSWGCVLFYSLCLTAMYVFMMSEEESLVVASFPRYFGTVMIYQLGLPFTALLMDGEEDPLAALPPRRFALGLGALACCVLLAGRLTWLPARWQTYHRLNQAAAVSRTLSAADQLEGQLPEERPPMLACVDYDRVSHGLMYYVLRYAFFQSGIWPLNENYWRESYYTGENDPCYILWLEPSAWAEEALAQAGIMVPEEPGLYYKDDTNQLTLVRELTG